MTKKSQNLDTTSQLHPASPSQRRIIHNSFSGHSQNPVLRFRKKTKNTSQKVFISFKWLCSQDAKMKASFHQHLSITNHTVQTFQRKTSVLAPKTLTKNSSTNKLSTNKYFFLVFPIFRLLPARLMMWMQAFDSMLAYKEKPSTTT